MRRPWAAKRATAGRGLAPRGRGRALTDVALDLVARKVGPERQVHARQVHALQSLDDARKPPLRPGTSSVRADVSFCLVRSTLPFNGAHVRLRERVLDSFRRRSSRAGPATWRGPPPWRRGMTATREYARRPHADATHASMGSCVLAGKGPRLFSEAQLMHQRR
jgi:hypothetical protein